MEAVILARHAESELSARGLVGGDPANDRAPLTAVGRDQARALGRLLGEDPVDLAVASEFSRTRETAEIALDGRGVPLLVLPDLNDIRFGSFEGELLSGYREWARHASPTEPSPGGGESRVDAARRFARGYRTILARPERLALVVAHGLPVRYALAAAGGRDPTVLVDPVDYAVPHRLSADGLEGAATRLERWCESPKWVMDEGGGAVR